MVRKTDLAITGRALVNKQRMTIAVGGGTNEVDVPRFLRDQASVSEEQLLEMAQLAVTLEATMNYLVDIECAYAGGKPYLLQCRPITALG